MDFVKTKYELTLQQRLACEAERRMREGLYVPREARRAAFQTRYRYDLAGFLRDCIDWERMVGNRRRKALSIPVGPTSYQLMVAEDMSEVLREAVKAPRGVGKTSIAAAALLHHAEVWDGYTDWKVISSASIWRQLQDFFWPEVHKLARFLRWDILGRPPYKSGVELMKMGLNLSTGQAMANASNKPDTMEGGHASQLFYIFDEAKIIPEATWDAVEGAFSDDEGKWLAVSTPGFAQGRFYDIHRHKAGYEDWRTRTITVEAAVAEGRVAQSWVDKRRAAWGEDSQLFRMQVMAEFGTLNPSAMIPLAWIEAANMRWEDWARAGFPGKLTGVAVDVGGGLGADMSTIALVYDRIHVRAVYCISRAVQTKQATMELVGRLAPFLSDGTPCFPDAIGIGTGVHDRMAELGYNVYPFIASAATDLLDGTNTFSFQNWRAAGWLSLREMLDPDNGIDVCLPPDDEIERLSGVVPNSTLTADLTAMRAWVSSAGKWRVPSKDDIRKEIGASTDIGDAVMMGLSGPILWEHAIQSNKPPRQVYDPERLR